MLGEENITQLSPEKKEENKQVYKKRESAFEKGRTANASDYCQNADD